MILYLLQVLGYSVLMEKQLHILHLLQPFLS